MRHQTARLTILMASIAVVITLWPGAADAQRRHPVKPAGVVFVGGYFYDPFLGPYPVVATERVLVRLLSDR